MTEFKTPCYVIDEGAVESNLRTLAGVMERTGCKILLAQKAFSCYALYPLIGKYLCGATASGLFEARLCHEEMPGAENHIYNPAFREEDFEEILRICDHIVFNSPAQLAKFGPRAKAGGLQVGLRINPEFSTQEGHAIYDPCAPGSRLGTTAQELLEAMDADPSLVKLLDGLHFHTLCEQNSDDLESTLKAVEDKFWDLLVQMKWINFGGGHHITRADYDIPRLERCIRHMQEAYGLAVYLEPGEAVALNAGYLYTTVLETRPAFGFSSGSVSGGASGCASGAAAAAVDASGCASGAAAARTSGVAPLSTCIVDASAACHMPDVIEMPYRPPLTGSGEAGEKAFTYRLGGPTCLAGDIIGDYSFDEKLQPGQVLEFCDMAIYSMVKNNTFNGMPLPSIYIKHSDGSLQLWKSFSYQDFKSRL